jgi:hypothetical protein
MRTSAGHSLLCTKVSLPPTNRHTTALRPTGAKPPQPSARPDAADAALGATGGRPGL